MTQDALCRQNVCLVKNECNISEENIQYRKSGRCVRYDRRKILRNILNVICYTDFVRDEKSDIIKWIAYILL